MNNKDQTPALLIGEGLPNFNSITPIQVEENIPILLNELNNKFNLFEKEIERNFFNDIPLKWEIIMSPLHEITESLRWSWGVVSHLNGAVSYTHLRAHET